MKQTFIFLLIIIMLVTMCACNQKDVEHLQPVNFYYHSDLTSENRFDTIFMPEIRESAGYDNATIDLLNLYLAGPIYGDLQNPFPVGLTVLSLNAQNKQTAITLSSEFSQLRGLDLSLACSCLCMTLFELFDCQRVMILCENTLPDGLGYIVIDKEDLVLYDDTYQAPES